MDTKQSLNYRSDIDGLRALAVIAVVAFHAIPNRFPGGFIGVDVFFVISGFLISSIILNDLKRDCFSFSDFYVRRTRRIFPALILVLVASWVAGWYILEPEAYAMLGRHMMAGAGFASNIILWSESGYFDPIAGSKPLLHLWSIGIEEQFYFIWPFLLTLASRATWKISKWIFFLLLISFLINILGIDKYPVATFYLPFSRFWELLLGALLAYVQLNHFNALKSLQMSKAFQFSKITVYSRDVVSLVGLVLIVSAIFILNEKSSFPGTLALIPTVGAAMLIASGQDGWINRYLLSHKCMVAIGLISYPLYLWHWPLFTFARMTSAMSEYPRSGITVLVGTALFLSYLTYLFVETPLRYGFTEKSKRMSLFLIGILTIVAGIGYWTNIDGLNNRYPLNARQFLNFKYGYEDYKENFRNDKCLLSGAQQKFSDECSGEGLLPRMLIWGDSHGAMLYGALNKGARENGMVVSQYTSSSCPPILDFRKNNRPLCKSINDDVFNKLQLSLPSTVVLAHDWPQSVQEDSLKMLPETVGKLRQAGVKKIIIVGPVPNWGRPLPSVLARHMLATNSSDVPSRLYVGVNSTTEALDDRLAKLSKSLSIDYVSPYLDFCNSDGCLAVIPDRTTGLKQLTAFDDTHLMPYAAEFFVAKNYSVFFQIKNDR